MFHDEKHCHVLWKDFKIKQRGVPGWVDILFYIPLVILLLGMLFVLSGCGNPAQTQQTLEILCNVDGIAVPLLSTGADVAGIFDPTLVPEIATAKAADQLVHPKVIDACNRIGGLPTAVQIISTPVVP